MKPLRAIILILTVLMQAFTAQSVLPLPMAKGAVCEMVCCAGLDDGGQAACECSAGGESPVAGVSALPPAMRESGPLAAELAKGGEVPGRSPEKRAVEAGAACLARWRAHLPKVRLAVLFCSFQE